MLGNILGLSVLGYFLVGVVLVLLGIIVVWAAGRNCIESITKIFEARNLRAGGGKCAESLKSLAMIAVVMLLYGILLFFISFYVIVFGWQNGWNQVTTLDLALSGGYVVVIIALLLRKWL
jgi:quinol-cytochrome oxidoreductase complex cytochrome b subunit